MKQKEMVGKEQAGPRKPTSNNHTDKAKPGPSSPRVDYQAEATPEQSPLHDEGPWKVREERDKRLLMMRPRSAARTMQPHSCCFCSTFLLRPPAAQSQFLASGRDCNPFCRWASESEE